MQVTAGASLLSYQPAKSGSSAAASKPSATNNGGLSQASDDSASGDSSVEQDFLNYAKMNPFDRIRASILKSMNLTEADLAKMTPEQQAAVEQKIRDAIEKQLKQKGQQPGSLIDRSA
jgi:TPP-dependent pyruvate/acetoin dehydrogenase alpha subunit